MDAKTPVDMINEVRRFNRFYTRLIGVLREDLLCMPFSLTEARILFELAHNDHVTASALCSELGLDPGYLSRMLANFEQQGLVKKTRSEEDGRQFLLHLTARGSDAFAILDQRARDEIAEVLSDVSDADQQQLLKAMHTIQGILDREKAPRAAEPFVLRTPEPGDMGWVAYRHGALYAEEFGWDEQYEASVAQTVSEFINHYTPARERCWIAEMGGENVGSVFVVQADDAVAGLRFLLVEPKARGLGLGTRLVEEGIRFAKRKGYHKLIIWSNSMLVAARHIYQKAGFTLVAQEKSHSYGRDLIAETWEMAL